jgi:hypothetical protein
MLINLIVIRKVVIMDWSKFNDDVKEAVAVGRQEATRERPYDNLYKSREQLEKIRDDLAKINDVR